MYTKRKDRFRVYLFSEGQEFENNPKLHAVLFNQFDFNFVLVGVLGPSQQFEGHFDPVS